MTKHVDRLLAAYVEQQLDSRRAREVYLHTQECPECFDRLLKHEQVSRELRRMAQSGPTLPAGQVDRWYLAIRSASTSATSYSRRPVWLPVMISLIIALVPVTLELAGVSDWHPVAATLTLTTTLVEPEQTGNMPLFAVGVPRPISDRAATNLVATPPPRVALPLAPAQLAPSQP